MFRREIQGLGPLLVGVALAVGCEPRGTATTTRPGERVDQGRASADDRVAEVAVGHTHSCARFVSGRVRCWGANAHHQLGDGSTNDWFRPRDVVGVDDAVDLDARGGATCAVRRSGEVVCWGTGAGWLTTSADDVPRPVPGISDAVAVSLGRAHRCVLRRGGRVSCWGAGESGQLGDGHAVDSDVPVNADIGDVEEVSAGEYLTCARTKQGESWCWGRSLYGLFENDAEALDECGTKECAKRPRRVLDVPKLRSIRTGSAHACGVQAGDEGKVACWGLNVGCGMGKTYPGLTRTTLPEIEGAVAMVSPQCALDAQGLVCWGQDERTAETYGKEDECSPYMRTAIAGVQSVAIGMNHRCAVVGPREVRCWGEGVNGQLGHGSLGHTDEPVVVADLFAPDRPRVDALTEVRAKIPQAKLSGRAAMWRDAAVFSAPRASARVGTFLPASDSRVLVRTTAVEVVADHGEFVEVSGLNKANGACGGEPLDTFETHSLTFFVRRDELAPVIADQYADSHDDGSAVLLAPGTPVVAVPAGVGAFVGGFFVQTYLGASDLSLSYDPAPLRALERRDWDAPAVFHHLTRGNLLGRETTLGRLPEDLQRRWELERDDGDLRLVLADECARVELTLHERPDEGRLGGAGVIGRSAGPYSVWRVPAGAPTFWPDGTRAGALRTKVRKMSTPDSVGKLRCWPAGDTVSLCYRAADVTESQEGR